MLAAAILLGVIVVCQLIALAWVTAVQAGTLERTELRWINAMESADERRICIIKAHDAVVADLLQRIQAPEAAVIQHQIVTSPRPDRPAPAFEDDAGFWESKEEMATRIANETP